MPTAPKQAGSVRRVSSSLSKVSTPRTSALARPSKSTKPSKIVQLKLSPETLSAFPRDEITQTTGQTKTSPKATTKAFQSTALTPPTRLKFEADTSSSQGGDRDDSQSPVKDIKQEGQNGVKTDTKRALGAGVEGDDPAKAKANPRKRPRVYASFPCVDYESWY